MGALGQDSEAEEGAVGKESPVLEDSSIPSSPSPGHFCKKKDPGFPLTPLARGRHLCTKAPSAASHDHVLSQDLDQMETP